MAARLGAMVAILRSDLGDVDEYVTALRAWAHRQPGLHGLHALACACERASGRPVDLVGFAPFIRQQWEDLTAPAAARRPVHKGEAGQRPDARA